MSARADALTRASRPATAHSLDRWIAGSLCAVLLVSALAVDPNANAGFDAPKRLLTLWAIVLATGFWVATLGLRPLLFGRSRSARLALAALLLAVLGSVLSLHASGYLPAAWDVLRTALLYSLLLPLGASAAMAGPARGWVLGCAALAIAINAVVSLLQAGGVELPLQMAAQSGRFATGALLGNEGYVALACALLGAGSAAVLAHPGGRWRLVAALLLALAVTTIAMNRQLTAAVALACAVAVVVAVRLRQSWLLPLGAGLVALAAVTAMVPALRALTWSQLPMTVAQYQQISTYRMGAWATALAMIEQRPWTGWGPNGFASQAQPIRLATEIQLQERLVPPPKANAFVQAHQEYLQLAAEAGVPVLLAVLLALGCLLSGLQRLARASGSTEPLLLLAVLCAGAVAALAWFPMQIPLTAVILLLACGRGWRLLVDAESGR